MEPEAQSRTARWPGLALGQVLAILFLAASVWWVSRELALVIGASKLTSSIDWTQDIDGVFHRRLAGFALVVLVLHLLLGIAAWALACLTRAAIPALPRERSPVLVVGWFLLLVVLLLAANSSWFPASRFATESSWLLVEWQGIALLTAMLAATAAAIAALIVMALRRAGPHRLHWQRSFAVTALLAIAVVVLPGSSVARSQANADSATPHIVILGLDSLRSDLTEPSNGRRLTPNIDRFLAGAHRFGDTVSPMARTFPAWVSILTGRHPVTTNARFNLMPRSMVHEGDTLADALQSRGYRSVYATDEVRFANLDGSYGFDQLITPPMGASDFVIGKVGDLPLVNLLAGTRLGGWLLPAIHANRAAYVTYEPRHFVSRLDRELRVSGPSFLAIHLTLSHWPYSWAGHAVPTTPQENRPAYSIALEAVDRQFQEVLSVLERKRVLDNAIVVVLSDHGEALGFPSDSILRKTGSPREIWDSLWGHGTSVVSPHQYSVMFAMRAMGRANLPGRPSVHDWPVALEDVRPTLEEIATGDAPAQVDGVSLLPYLADEASASELDERIRFTETGLNMAKMMAGEFNSNQLASEGAVYYQMMPETGWLQLRSGLLPEIMATKQRAALSRDSLLAYIPSWTDESVTYLYSERRSPMPRRLQGRPDPVADPEAARLWDALQERFPGELRADTGLR